MFAFRFIFRPSVIRCIPLAVLFILCGHLSAQPPDDGGDIRGPKAPVEIPIEKKPPVAMWTGVGGGMLVLALAAFLLGRYVRRQKSKTPRELAFSSLTKLEQDRETMTAEAFANRAAQTVRQYISDRFGLAAPRRTTEEFLGDLANDSESSLLTESDHLRAFLKSCDLAKFAGSNLDASQRGELLQSARSFITVTSMPVAATKGGKP